MEGSFADAANNHGFKRARWRRLWRQRIQDYLIATVQNVRILLRAGKDPRAAEALGRNGRIEIIAPSISVRFLVLTTVQDGFRVMASWN